MPAAHSSRSIIEPRRTILVFQGGGALGAYQAGVFEALVETGRQPDWVVGTSIGAINAALIAGNPPELRLTQVRGFWERMAGHMAGAHGAWSCTDLSPSFVKQWRNFYTMAFGISGFFQPRAINAFAFNQPTDPESASFYDVSPLRETLIEFVDFDYLAKSPVRISVGAVDVESAKLTYFDSKHCQIRPEHILASGALPPAFSPVKIDGRHYWDGGIYSNTPLEWILRDQPRDHSLCLFPTLWQQTDSAPTTLPDVLRRCKEIQFASRAETLIEMERELHRLRHAINLLTHELADHSVESPYAELACLGCGSVFHLIHMQLTRLAGEDHTKDLEFDPDRVGLRWAAGLSDTRRALQAEPWRIQVEPTEGIVVHDFVQQ